MLKVFKNKIKFYINKKVKKDTLLYASLAYLSGINLKDLLMDPLFFNFRKSEPFLREGIISANQSGLGNRLKCLISSMMLADKTSKGLILYWPENNYCYCRFSDLFENQIIEIARKNFIRIQARIYLDKRYTIIQTWRLLVLPNSLSTNFIEGDYLTNNWIDFKFEQIPLSVRNNFLIYINKLIPTEFIRREVENFSKLFDEHTVSIAIRSYVYEKDVGCNFKIEKVYETMDKLSDSNFFVSCDSPVVLEKIVKRYGKRVIYYPQRTTGDHRCFKEGVQNTLIELLLLSKNRNLKISPGSSFSEMAWWFSGCTTKVEPLHCQNFKRGYRT